MIIKKKKAEIVPIATAVIINSISCHDNRNTKNTNKHSNNNNNNSSNNSKHKKHSERWAMINHNSINK